MQSSIKIKKNLMKKKNNENEIEIEIFNLSDILQL